MCRHGVSAPGPAVAGPYTPPVAANTNPPSPSRTTTLAVLVVGSILALGCAFGPAWLVRVGLAIAVLTAVASVLTTWRQMDRMVAEHTAQLQQLRDEAREAAHRHHAESMAMIDRFAARTAAWKQEIAEARSEIEALRADHAAASLDAEAKQTRISALNKVVADLEKQLRAAEQGAPALATMPRRGVALRRTAVDLSERPLVYPVAQQA